MPQEVTEDILFASVRHLGNLIRTRKLSPVGLTEAYLDRLRTLGPRLGAVVTITKELALKEARAAEREIYAGRYRGALHGIPYGVKDLVATRGIPTTWGARPLKNQVFDYDGTVIEKLRAAGAVLVAKLAMVELAGGFGYNNADASFTGPGRTPWNLKYWSGGSSSGPAAATAAGLVAFAIGSETSGSIITPAAFCGVSGLRPTYGRVSRHGAMALSWTLDKLGPMCRTADDCGLVLAAIAGRDRRDPSSAARMFVHPEPKANGTKFKIGVCKHATRGAQPEVKKTFRAALKVLSGFAEVVPDVAYPDLPFGTVLGTIFNAEAASAFQDLLDSGRCRDMYLPDNRWGGYAASMVLAGDYLQALRVRGVMKRALDELYGRYDALVAPARGTVAYPVAKDFSAAYPNFGGGLPLIQGGNVVGQPALAVPNGFGENQLPTAIQFTGRAWSEARLIGIAHAYQQATGWHRKRPPLPPMEKK